MFLYVDFGMHILTTAWIQKGMDSPFLLQRLFNRHVTCIDTVVHFTIDAQGYTFCLVTSDFIPTVLLSPWILSCNALFVLELWKFSLFRESASDRFGALGLWPCVSPAWIFIDVTLVFLFLVGLSSDPIWWCRSGSYAAIVTEHLVVLAKHMVSFFLSVQGYSFSSEVIL